MASSNSDSSSSSQLPRPSTTSTSTSAPSTTSASNPSNSSILQSPSNPTLTSHPTSSGSSTPTQRIPATSTSSTLLSNLSSSPRRPHTSLASHHSRLPSGSTASFLATPTSTVMAGGSSLYIPSAAPAQRRISGVPTTASVPSSMTRSRPVASASSSPSYPSSPNPSFYNAHHSNNNWQSNGNQDSFGSTGNNNNNLGHLTHFSHPNFNNPSSSSRLPDSNLNGINNPETQSSSSPFEENSLISFSWTISDLKLLRDEVEFTIVPSEGGRSVSAGAGKSEVWTKQPRFGSGNWMVDLGTYRDDEDQETTVEEGEEPNNEHQEQETQSDQQTSSSNQSKGKEQKLGKKPTVLSVYLTCSNQNSTSSLTHIMIGLKPISNSSSSNTSNSQNDWVYQHFSTFQFSREHDFLEHHDLPTLTSLLSNESIESQDAVQLVIQIASGNGLVGEILSSAHSELSKKQLDESNSTSSSLAPIFDPKKVTFPFSLPDVKSIPSSMVDSLRGLLDCQLTADVRILVRERGIVRPNQSTDSSEDQTEGGEENVAYLVESFPVGSPLPSWFDSQIHGDEDGRPKEVFRHRTLWAHSSILKARSDYFRTMLDSEFIESQEEELRDERSINNIYDYQQSDESFISGRKVKTLRISDSDLGTVYWLLRHLYLNDVRFESLEDVKTSGMDLEDVENNGSGKSEVCWDWKTLEELELRSRLQGEETESNLNTDGNESLNRDGHEETGVNNHHHLQHRQQQQHSPSRNHGLSNHDRRASNRSISSRNSLNSIHTKGNGNGNGSGNNSNDSQLQPSSTLTSPTSSVTYNPSSSSRNQTQIQNQSTDQNLSFNPSSNLTNQDPHSHPIDYATGAYSLALYKLSHRYGQNDLAEVAKKHLLNNLNPKNAFQTLLATSLYKEVQLGVRAWVYDNWSLVSSTEEFGNCLLEISAGEYGPEAGATLQSFMKLLRSPTRR